MQPVYDLSMSSQVYLNANDLPLVKDKLMTLGVEFETVSAGQRVQAAVFPTLRPHTTYVDNSTRVFLGGGTTVHHHHHHHANRPSDQETQRKREERQVALGIFAAIAAAILTYFIGRSINSISDAKTTKEFLAHYRCENGGEQIVYETIQQAVDSVVTNRMWAIINRIIIVAGLILVAAGAFLPLMPLVALGGALVLAGALSAALKLGIYGLEGRQHDQIRKSFGQLEESKQQHRANSPTAPSGYDEGYSGLDQSGFPRGYMPHASGTCYPHAYGQPVSSSQTY